MLAAVMMPRDGWSRKKEGLYNKVSDNDVLDGLLVEADRAKQYDIDLETGEGREVELGECEDFLRLNLADEDYAYVPPLVAEVMSLGVQEVDLVEAQTEGDRQGEHNPSQVEEELDLEPEGVEDLGLDEVGGTRLGGEDVVEEEAADLGEEIVAARTRKRKERVKSAREGQLKRSRREGRSGGSESLAEITQALEGTGEVQPYLAHMAYDMRHRSRDMHALEEVHPLADIALAKEKLTRESICRLLFSTALGLGLCVAM